MSAGSNSIDLAFLSSNTAPLTWAKLGDLPVKSAESSLYARHEALLLANLNVMEATILDVSRLKILAR